MEEEIDLRKYIGVLRRRWKLIVSITVLAVFVAGLVSFLMPPVYEARAAVLITKFAPEYQASEGGGLITAGGLNRPGKIKRYSYSSYRTNGG